MATLKWILSTLLIICLVAAAEAAGKCDGTEIGMLRTLAHDVTGVVYALDETTLGIRGFRYDGQGPAAYFWVGDASRPDRNGIRVPYPGTNSNRDIELERAINANIILPLPGNTVISDIRYLSVWCEEFHQDFGNVVIPNSIRNNPPSSLSLGDLESTARGVAGDVTIQNAKKIIIDGFSYNGGGSSDTHFAIGTGRNPGSTNPRQITKLTWNTPGNNVEGALRRLSNKKIEVSIPLGTDICNGIKWFAVYDFRSETSYGVATLPSDFSIPPDVTLLKAGTQLEFRNCQDLLNRKIQMQWEVDGDYIYFELAGVIRDSDYMAFGISGSESGTQMFGADVTMATYSMQTGAIAVDYHIDAKAACSAGSGVCPDQTAGGNEDVQVISGSRVNGITRVRYVRRKDTGDAEDQVYKTGQFIYLVWSFGPLNSNGLITYHGFDGKIQPDDDLRLRLDRTGQDSCGRLDGGDDGEPVKPWPHRK